MAASRLAGWLAGNGATLRWIEFADYARHVFAADSDDWYREPARFAAALIQAQGILASDCISFDITAPFADGGSEVAPALFEQAAPRAFVGAALDALLHRFEGRVDIVIKLRAPWDLLGGGEDPGFDALDDLSTALAAVMRPLAERPLAGLLIETARGAALGADEVDAYEPLISAARHYGWCTALALPADVGASIAPPALDLDLVLWPQCALSQVAMDAVPPRRGGGLHAAVWRGTASLDAALGGRLLYGTVPAQATPETVLSVARALQA